MGDLEPQSCGERKQVLPQRAQRAHRKDKTKRTAETPAAAEAMADTRRSRRRQQAQVRVFMLISRSRFHSIYRRAIFQTLEPSECVSRWK